jgi:hypothetical protein
MSRKPLVAFILLTVLSLAACQPQNGSGTSDAKSDPTIVPTGGMAGGGGGGGY